MANRFESDYFSSNRIPVNGTEYLFFSGTSYLGLNHNAVFRQHITEGLLRYGSSYGSSRNANLQLRVYEEAEAALATFSGAPAALTVSSGFAAGQLVVNAFRATHHFLYAPDTHPAVCLEPHDFYSGNFEAWTREIDAAVANVATDRVAVVCNAVDPLWCQPLSFDWVAALPEHKKIVLVIDDSHGLGVAGTDGSGIYKCIPKRNNIHLVVISSLAKAMGMPGGVVLGDAETLTSLQHFTTFRAASPMPPAFLYAFIHSGELYSEALEKLRDNLTFFKNQFPVDSLFQYLPDYPVFYTPTNRLTDFLNKNNIIISSFPYPKPDSNIITRVIINANHSKSEIRQLAGLLNSFEG